MAIISGMAAFWAELYVVVHPKYRTVGLGIKLTKETLRLVGTEYVEMSTVMAKYNPFAEKAGMKRILEERPPKEAVKIVKALEGARVQHAASWQQHIRGQRTADPN
jgi:hypothetical protein